MLRSFFSRIGWGPPTSLAFTAAAIDISSGSVKFFQFGEQGDALVVKQFGATPLQPDVIVDGEIEKSETIIDVLRTFRTKNRIQFAHASLSEKKAFIYQQLIPSNTKSVRDAIEFELESHVPLPPQEAVFDYEFVRTVSGGSIYAVTAYAERVVNVYEKVFRTAGIVLRSLEVEAQALVRAVLPEHARTGVALVVDIGSHTTRIAIADHGVVSYTATMDFGTEVLLESIMRQLQVDHDEAIKIKDARGFLVGKENHEVVEAVIGLVSVFKDELARHITYWNHPVSDDVSRPPIDLIIISGGNAGMRGLIEYINDSFGIRTMVANVWVNSFSLDTYIPPMPWAKSLEFATGVGLALRSAHKEPW